MTRLPVLIKEFANGHKARAVRTNGKTDPAAVVAALNIPHPSGLLILSGGAGKMDHQDYLPPLFAAIGRLAAQHPGLIVIDGGTQSGVMKLMGEGLAGMAWAGAHIGVLPAGADIGRDGQKAEDDLEPHHSNFVLVDSKEWGDEVEMMYRLAAYLSAHVPSVALLVNGGAIALQEIEQNVQQGREIIVVAGSGRLADEIAGAIRQSEQAAREPIASLIRQGHFTLFDLSDSPDRLIDLLQQRLGK
jgi:hypothetical protein